MSTLDQLLTPKVQQFIRTHENDDEKKLILKQRELFGVPMSLVAQQIIGRRKVKEKVPTYYKQDNILFPPSLNLEQSSSEVTALQKLDILHSLQIPRGSAIDLTGGFGIDSFFLSQFFESLVYIEPNKSLLEIARHNHLTLGAKRIDHQEKSAETFITSHTGHVDLVYLDPSRRSEANQKVFKLDECEPNVGALQDVILKHASFLLVKTSPLLDIQHGIRALRNVAHVFVLSVNNECKEVLFLCTANDVNTTAKIHAVDIRKNFTESIVFNLTEEQNAISAFDKPQRYLYEPNASILKAGAFKTTGARFHLHKVHVNTHLYTSNQLVENFPGRIFEVETFLKSDPKTTQSYFEGKQANIMVRNFPMTPEELKAKYKLRDGGDLYLIAFSGVDRKYMAKCSRLK